MDGADAPVAGLGELPKRAAAYADLPTAEFRTESLLRHKLNTLLHRPGIGQPHVGRRTLGEIPTPDAAFFLGLRKVALKTGKRDAQAGKPMISRPNGEIQSPN